MGTEGQHLGKLSGTRIQGHTNFKIAEGDISDDEGLFLPAVVGPILDSFETAKQVPQPALSDMSPILQASQGSR
ncbi:hypothetical protein PVAP13_3NG044390 [Panicum virgatum]|uniref:Uncharacterized protein n=1 Tax=Panicum virgatum TaxID=38727 RepID=A0A8T0U3S0_PANVG|nr:hypothetical protein PVAP13_3NG044390 [Panicum virgatum]